MKNLQISPDKIEADGRKLNQPAITVQAALTAIKNNIGNPKVITNETAILAIVEILIAAAQALENLGQ